MRFAVLASVVMLAATATAMVWICSGPAMASPPSGSAASGELITLSTVLPDRKQQLIVIDPRVRVMSLYHIDQASGEITLKSVRNIHWDLQMSEFNGTSPSPREIRAMAEQYR